MSTKDLGVFLLPHLTLIATWNNQEIMNATSIWAANVGIRIDLIFLRKVVVSVEIVDKFDLRQSSAWTLYHWIRDTLVFSLLQGRNNQSILKIQIDYLDDTAVPFHHQLETRKSMFHSLVPDCRVHYLAPESWSSHWMGRWSAGWDCWCLAWFFLPLL